jgi:hypothetical protein
MPKIHDHEDAEGQGAEASQAFAEEDAVRIPELSIECPFCWAPPGKWCMKYLGFDEVQGLHAKRFEKYHEGT